jgi:4-carboxymuconolactone decarboxylase
MDKESFEQGLAIRKEVLSAEHVERSLAGADDFNRPYQELVTEYCWGAVWGRPGLSRKTRSLLNLAMLTALNRRSSNCTCARRSATASPGRRSARFCFRL